MSLVLLAFLLAPFLTPAQNIPALDASRHVGEQGTVCGRVAGVKIETSARGTPTFIDFEKPYPNQTFTAVIWERDKATIGDVPRVGVLCVKGTITEYRGRPQIVLHSRSDWSAPQATLSNDNHYRNVDGQSVHSPHIPQVECQRARLLNVLMERTASVLTDRERAHIMAGLQSGCSWLNDSAQLSKAPEATRLDHTDAPMRSNRMLALGGRVP